MILRSALLLFIALALRPALAQQVLPLYSGDIPNAIVAPDEESLRDPKEPYRFLLSVSRPTLSPYLPKRPDAKRTAVIVVPGGSYRGVSIVKEGTEVARAFSEMGIAAFVLKYRSPSDRHMTDRTRGPLQDLQQAIRMVRERAAEWKIDPDRVGIVGFSAGGHLAATAGTHFDQPVLPAWKGANLRPDFMVLIYPVISMMDPLAHKVSRENLLGRDPAEAMMRAYSNELTVTEKTPPTFLMHTVDDSTVNVDNTIRFFEALKSHKVTVELVVYPAGGHGFGLANATTSDRWIDRCREWLISQGWIAGPPRS